MQVRTSEPLEERKVQRKVDALFVELRRDALTCVRYARVKSSFHSRCGVAVPTQEKRAHLKSEIPCLVCASFGYCVVIPNSNRSSTYL